MNILILPGDGIGPEITTATMTVLQAVNKEFALPLTFTTEEIGLASLKNRGSTFPETVLEATRRADGVILGPVSHSDYPPRAEGGINVPCGVFTAPHVTVFGSLLVRVAPSVTGEPGKT